MYTLKAFCAMEITRTQNVPTQMQRDEVMPVNLLLVSTVQRGARLLDTADKV